MGSRPVRRVTEVPSPAIDHSRKTGHLVVPDPEFGLWACSSCVWVCPHGYVEDSYEGGFCGLCGELAGHRNHLSENR